jgi:hypothetical protein
MLDTDKIDPEVLNCIVRNMGYDGLSELSKEDKEEALRRVSRLSFEAAINKYLVWHGIINYTDNIVSAVDSLRKSAQS